MLMQYDYVNASSLYSVLHLKFTKESCVWFDEDGWIFAEINVWKIS